MNQFKYQVSDWELGNELNLLVKDSSGSPLWGKGWTANEFNTPLMQDWAAVLKGMSDAIDKINKDNRLALRRTLNTTSTMFGFLDYMQSQGVKFETVSYHYYESGNTNPNNYWGGSKPSFNLFSKLASYNRPITVNEMNCAEIYKAGFENTSGKTMTEACYKSLDAMLNYFSGQKIATISSINLYEIVDEPAKPGAEGKFGLMYDVKNPKLSLAILSKYTGKGMTLSENSALKLRGIK